MVLTERLADSCRVAHVDGGVVLDSGEGRLQRHRRALSLARLVAEADRLEMSIFHEVSWINLPSTCESIAVQVDSGPARDWELRVWWRRRWDDLEHQR